MEGNRPRDSRLGRFLPDLARRLGTTAHSRWYRLSLQGTVNARGASKSAERPPTADACA